MRRGRLSDQLKLLRKGNEIFVKQKDKDITSLAAFYNIKGLKTSRPIVICPKTKKCHEILKIKKI